MGCNLTPSNTKPTLFGLPCRDDARVDTSALRSDGGVMEDGKNVCIRGMKSITFVAIGGSVIT